MCKLKALWNIQREIREVREELIEYIRAIRAFPKATKHEVFFEENKMSNEYDATKWNASCDLLWEMIQRPNAEMRGVIRDELCCDELLSS